MEKPAYYAVIPANVRYAPIKANAKLLYGEITALSNKEGYCWATNSYFASLYGVTEKQISQWIKELFLADFINIKIDKSKGNMRYISVSHPIHQKVKTYTPKGVEGIHQKVGRYTPKGSDPIYMFNNTKNNTKNREKIVLEKNTENRGKESQAKEKIRQAIQSGKIKEL